MSEIVWEEPPPPSRTAIGGKRVKRGEMTRFVDLLRDRPGEWARWPHDQACGSNASHSARRYPGTEWAVRLIAPGVYRMWARWVGPTKQENR